jgi:hypothetical protein
MLYSRSPDTDIYLVAPSSIPTTPIYTWNAMVHESTDIRRKLIWAKFGSEAYNEFLVNPYLALAVTYTHCTIGIEGEDPID